MEQIFTWPWNNCECHGDGRAAHLCTRTFVILQRSEGQKRARSEIELQSQPLSSSLKLHPHAGTPLHLCQIKREQRSRRQWGGTEFNRGRLPLRRRPLWRLNHTDYYLTSEFSLTYILFYRFYLIIYIIFDIWGQCTGCLRLPSSSHSLLQQTEALLSLSASVSEGHEFQLKAACAVSEFNKWHERVRKPPRTIRAMADILHVSSGKRFSFSSKAECIRYWWSNKVTRVRSEFGEEQPILFYSPHKHFQNKHSYLGAEPHRYVTLGN